MHVGARTHTHVSWMLRRMKPAGHLRMKVSEDKLSRGGVGLSSDSGADVPRFPEPLEAPGWRASGVREPVLGTGRTGTLTREGRDEERPEVEVV